MGIGLVERHNDAFAVVDRYYGSNDEILDAEGYFDTVTDPENRVTLVATAMAGSGRAAVEVVIEEVPAVVARNPDLELPGVVVEHQDAALGHGHAEQAVDPGHGHAVVGDDQEAGAGGLGQLVDQVRTKEGPVQLTATFEQEEGEPARPPAR